MAEAVDVKKHPAGSRNKIRKPKNNPGTRSESLTRKSELVLIEAWKRCGKKVERHVDCHDDRLTIALSLSHIDSASQGLLYLSHASQIAVLTAT